MEQTKFELKFINPLTDDYDVYNINTSNRSRIGFDRLKPFETQEDLINIIDNLLISIDCTKLICNMPQTKIGCYKYDSDMSDLIYYCSKLVNPIEYESYIKRISEIHAHNVAFESTIKQKPVSKSKKNKTKKSSEPWIVRETLDLFTGEKVYMYMNTNTGEEITSSDGDKLKELNAPKKKEKRIKSNVVPMEHMTFSFKIK